MMLFNAAAPVQAQHRQVGGALPQGGGHRGPREGSGLGWGAGEAPWQGETSPPPPVGLRLLGSSPVEAGSWAGPTVRAQHLGRSYKNKSGALFLRGPLRCRGLGRSWGGGCPLGSPLRGAGEGLQRVWGQVTGQAAAGQVMGQAAVAGGRHWVRPTTRGPPSSPWGSPTYTCPEAPPPLGHTLPGGWGIWHFICLFKGEGTAGVGGPGTPKARRWDAGAQGRRRGGGAVRGAVEPQSASGAAAGPGAVPLSSCRSRRLRM